MGANLKSYSTNSVSVDVRIRGIYEKDHRAKIERQCKQLANAASRFVHNDDFAVALVTYSDESYAVYGLGFGPRFPTGSKITLARFGFETVDDRFESLDQKPEDTGRFDSALKGQIEHAVNNYSTDLQD